MSDDFSSGYSLVPVDYVPQFKGVTLVSVDHNPEGRHTFSLLLRQADFLLPKETLPRAVYLRSQVALDSGGCSQEERCVLQRVVRLPQLMSSVFNIMIGYVSEHLRIP